MRWAWREGLVDAARDHFELRFRSRKSSLQNQDAATLVARVGAPSGKVFPVEFVFDLGDVALAEAVADVRHELDFYLVELGEPDPFAYAQYHCGTSSNIYSSVHWSFHEGQQEQK